MTISCERDTAARPTGCSLFAVDCSKCLLLLTHPPPHTHTKKKKKKKKVCVAALGVAGGHR